MTETLAYAPPVEAQQPRVKHPVKHYARRAVTRAKELYTKMFKDKETNVGGKIKTLFRRRMHPPKTKA